MSGSDPQKRPESKYRRSSAPPGPVEWSRHQGIVMMMSKLTLGKKEKYVRVVCDVYCLFCVFVFVDKKEIAETRDRTIGSLSINRFYYI